MSDSVNIWPKVEKARAGLVVPCDAALTADALRRLLANPAEAREIGRRGRELAAEWFSMSAVGDQMLRVHEKILERSLGHREILKARAAVSG
jgi:glycosyltransferase involved in cell wall biosynthesis